MFICSVCGAKECRQELIDEVFRVEVEYVLVDSIPAMVCVRCGEQTVSRETAERVRLMVHGEAKATRSVPMQVFDYVS